MAARMITPGKLPLDRIAKAPAKALVQSGLDVKRRQTRFVGTWRKKPDFEEEGPKEEKGDLVWRRFSDSTPYIYVELGTKVRYAQMSPDFTAKTSPRQLASGLGSGRMLYVDTRKPKPGIEARESNVVIVEEVSPLLLKRMQFNISKSFRSTT